MMTPTHILVGLTTFGERGANSKNAAALAGGLAPDAFLYGLWIWSKAAAIPEATLWREIYWSDPVQAAGAVSNSIPLYMAILTVGLLIDLRWLAIFGSACMLHITLDLPFHADDAHQHFWPLTEWRFHSPLSYWDTDYHAAYVRVLEIAAALAMVFVLWRRHTARWVKAALAVTFALYAAVPVYFISTLG